jgi:hypothetical protein
MLYENLIRSMPYLRTTSFLAALTVALISCENDKEINELHPKMDSVTAMINRLRDSSISLRHALESLQSLADDQMQSCRALTDSCDYYVRDNPMAVAYMRTFDRAPMDIVEEYMSATTDAERDKFLFATTILGIYGQSNQGHIDTVRNDLRRFDQRKKTYMYSIKDIQHKIDTQQERSLEIGQEIESLSR